MTAADGRFQIANVPSGEYRLVAWLPNADLAGVDRDPNTGMILRHHYAEPLRVEWAVHVDPGRTSEVDFWLSK